MGLSVSLQAQFTIPEQYKLKNGMEVVFMDYGTLPITSFNFYINIGKRNETPGLQGLSAITVDALLLGNEKMDRITLDKNLYEMGTSISTSSGDLHTRVAMNVLNRDVEKGLELLATTLLQPTFPEEQVKNQLRELTDFNNPAKMDIGALASLFASHAVYGADNPLGRHYYPKQLSKVTVAKIKEFYQFNYTPKNTRLVVSGKPDKEKVKQLLEQLFGGWEAAYGELNAASFGVPTIKGKETYFVNRDKATQAALVWVKNAPKINSKDALAFNIANIAFNDLLFEVIREKEGKTYGIYSRYRQSDNPGLYEVVTQVRSEVAHATVESFDKVCETFSASGITQEELEVARSRMKSRLISAETPGQIASFINPLLYPNTEKRIGFLDDLEEVDLKTVNKVIKKYFEAGDYTLVIAGDEQVLNAQLSKVDKLKKLPTSAIETDGTPLPTGVTD